MNIGGRVREIIWFGEAETSSNEIATFMRVWMVILILGVVAVTVLEFGSWRSGGRPRQRSMSLLSL